ncbi:MAG: UvrD-helicase domain-containing protein [Patescibacteria group bacterium]
MLHENNKQSNILDGLNDRQKEAITTIDGPILIIAGAGSGKTKALTHRIAYLINQNIEPTNILAVTFTNKAASEMKERVKNILKETGLSVFPTISTFHSFCAKILRHEIHLLGYTNNFIIFDSNDQLSLMKKIIKNLNVNSDKFKPKTMLNAISDAKNELIDHETYEKNNEGFFEETMVKFYNEYQRELKKNNAVDFDDLIMLTVQIFQKYPQILKKYQNQYKYILIDEYQDTNQAQYILTKLLAQKNNNICVVGDDWQCIYSWRKADFRNILKFEKDWPNAKIIMLEENYRSTQNILNASHGIISKNIYRTDKKLWTEAEKGALIAVNEVWDENAEGQFILKEINKLISEQKYSPKDFVVLYRTNAQSRAIEESFLQANFPYKIIGTVRFYARREVKDVLAYLRLLINPADTISLQRIINVPPRGIGKASVEKIVTETIDITDEHFLKNKLILPLKAHKSLIDLSGIISYTRDRLDTLNLTKLINTVLSRIGYENFVKDGTDEGESRWENVQELITVAKKYNSLNCEIALKQLLEDITLISESDEIDSEKNMVNLMTLHSVKGLEFPVVFITGCEEGLLPHSRSWTDPAQMEEERRLCYVGLTRAKKIAYMTFAAQRNLYGRSGNNAPSRFIADIPKHLINFQSQILGNNADNENDNDEIINL